MKLYFAKQAAVGQNSNMSYEQFVLLAAKRSSELVEKMLEKLA